MAGTLSLPAHAILALNHGLLDGPELQRKAKLVSNTAQLLFLLCNVRLPISVPHQPGLGIHAGNAGSGSIEPFLTIKALPGDIAQRDVCHPQVVHKPGRLFSARETPCRKKVSSKPNR